MFFMTFFRLKRSLLLTLGGMLVSGGVLAQVTEAELKAAFLFNFTKFVEWPAQSLATTPGSLNVCLFGPRDAFFDAIHELNGKPVKSRNLSVRAVGRGEAPRNCQVLVMAESEADQFETVLKRLNGAPVLTVNGAGHFLDAGGIIGFAMEGDKLRFDINLTAAQRGNLELSSNLLRLARQVRRP
jgi:hypothetical protein